MKTKHLIIIAFLVLLSSCVRIEVYNVNDDNLVWFADSTNCRFTMQDENGVSQTVALGNVGYEWLSGSSYLLFVPTGRSEHEYVYQSGFFSFGQQFSVSLQAYKQDDDCDDFCMRIGDANYSMRIDGNSFHPTCLNWDNAYDTVFTAEYLDNFAVMNRVYDGVMHLELVDGNQNDKFFPSEIYYAKNYGLIQFSLNNGLEYKRLPSE